MNNTYRDFYNIRILKDDGTIKEACIRRQELDARQQQLIAASSQPIGQMPYPDSLKVVMPDGRVGYDTSGCVRASAASPYGVANLDVGDAEASMATEGRIRHDDLAARVINLEVENVSLRDNCRDYEQRLKTIKEWISKALRAFEKIEDAMQELYGDD
jgi:hypothetical protein